MVEHGFPRRKFALWEHRLMVWDRLQALQGATLPDTPTPRCRWGLHLCMPCVSLPCLSVYVCTRQQLTIAFTVEANALKLFFSSILSQCMCFLLPASMHVLLLKKWMKAGCHKKTKSFYPTKLHSSCILCLLAVCAFSKKYLLTLMGHIFIVSFTLLILLSSLHKCILDMKAMQIKAKLWSHLTPERIVSIKKWNNSKCWWGCGIKRTLLHYWQERRLAQPL